MGPCTVRSKLNKFEHVLGGMGPGGGTNEVRSTGLPSLLTQNYLFSWEWAILLKRVSFISVTFFGHWKHYPFFNHRMVVQICRSWKEYYSICLGGDFYASCLWFHHEPQNWVWRKTHQRKVEFSEISCKHPLMFSWISKRMNAILVLWTLITFLFTLNVRLNYTNTVLLRFVNDIGNMKNK